MASTTSSSTASSSSSVEDKVLVVKNPKVKDTATVILMHGLGDTARGWEDAAHFISAKLSHVKFILPTAPVVPVTLNQGDRMPAWYDLEGLDFRSNEKCAGIEASVETINQIIAKEAATRPYDRIMVAGFSQGGALSLYAGLQQKERLAGLVCMSGYLPKPTGLPLIDPSLHSMPVRLFHGTIDEVVKPEYARQTLKFLQEKGMEDVVLREYSGLPHSASVEELNDVKVFIEEVMPEGANPELQSSL